MCSETFLRLPEEKRKRIIDAAWEEFTRVRYTDASINQIVRRARIPRGSFYQYFTDKESLVAYLLGGAWDYLVEAYSGMLHEQGGDLFALQIACFDRFQDQCREGIDPVLNRFLCFLRLNQGLDIQNLVCGRPLSVMFERALPEIDRSMLRQQDEPFIRHVLTLSLMTLAHMVVESTIHPEKADECRKDLLARLEIIRCGSVKQ